MIVPPMDLPSGWEYNQSKKYSDLDGWGTVHWIRHTVCGKPYRIVEYGDGDREHIVCSLDMDIRSHECRGARR